MTFNGLQTIYSIQLMNRMLIGKPYKPLPNTTLNELFGIEERTRKSDIYPKINLITIGYNKNTITESTTKYKLLNNQHSATDAALFNHIPFYLRKESEINLYPIPPYLRLRKKLIINNETYIAYYGKIITEFITKNDITLLKFINDDYAKITKLDTNTEDFLHPEPNVNLDLRYGGNDFIGDFVKIYEFWDNEDIENIRHAMDVLGVEEKVIKPEPVPKIIYTPEVEETVEENDEIVEHFKGVELFLNKSVKRV